MFQLANNPAFSDTAAELDAALSVCSSFPKSAGETSDRLLGAGWISEPDAVMAAMTSGVFAFLLKPEDIAYSLDNGTFMAASVLGNSALPPNQPGFSANVLRLAILAGETEQGYCVLSGNDGLLTHLQAALPLTESLSDEVQSRFEGMLAGRTVQVVALKRSQLEPLIASAKPQYVDPATFVFDDINVLITPAKQEAQE
jgi:hypothetical protein